MNPRIHSNALNIATLILNRAELEKAIIQDDVVLLSDDQIKELVKILEIGKAAQFD